MRVVWLKDLRMADLERVGGKNASLGEMMSALAAAGIRVPGGFATTAQAFREFLSANGLEARIEQRLHSLAPKDVIALAACGAEIRSWILKAPFPANVEREIKSYYQYLEQITSGEVSFAVRSSATAEDLPEASFAGQQETFLNIRGIDNILEAIRRVYASLYNERAISYRTHHGFDHRSVALSAAVQQRVRSDLGASGVMFTLDTESGFRDVVFITAAYGLGELIVQGAVNPDEFYVHKPMLEQGRPAIVRRALGSKLEKMLFAGSAEAGRSTRVVEVGPEERARFSLTDPEVLELARYALAIERHYGRPMDIEWAKDGADGKLYVLQARPETVKSRKRDTGRVFEGLLPFEVSSRERGEMPRIAVKIAMNVGNPDLAFEFAQLPNAGVGLARLEFIINNEIGVHPRACLEYADLPAALKKKLDEKCRGYADPRSFFREKMVEGVATIAAAFWPKPVIVRLSDFKSNEYKKLLGGERYEPDEENPMLGFRGASRYVAPSFRECFELECAALKKVRDELGLTNVELMVPFVRTLGEAKQVMDLLEKNGLKRGTNGLRVVMMCELPSNALLAEEFLELFDGFSIGSNDLTQLTLGLDRDSGLVAESFDERDAAVKAMLAMAIRACRKHGKYVGICGQGPSDHPDLARWLMEQGIESLSLNPDTVVSTWLSLAEAAPQKKSAAA